MILKVIDHLSAAGYTIDRLNKLIKMIKNALIE